MSEQQAEESQEAESEDLAVPDEGDQDPDESRQDQDAKDDSGNGKGDEEFGGKDPEDYQPTTDLPEARAEEPDPPPGGPHAVPGVGGDGAYTGIAHDPDPRKNPETDNELPEETTEPEDTDTEATKGEDETSPEKEAPA